jgi:CRP-like cAMP-binding protein
VPTVNQIRDVILFAGLDDGELATVAGLLQEEKYSKDQEIFHEGDPGDKFYIVSEGMVSIALNIDGVGSEELLYLEPPAFFGEMALIDAEPRSASAICRRPTILLSLDKEAFEHLIDEDIELGNKLMIGLIRTFCSRIRKSNEKLRNYFMINRAFLGS